MEYIFDFQNAGEVWTFFGAITSFAVVVIALFPLLKDILHTSSGRGITRNRLLFDLEILHESYFGKILTRPEFFSKADNDLFKIPTSDFGYFEKIETYYPDLVNLTRTEKDCVAEILTLFRRSTYRKIDGEHYMRAFDIVQIEYFTKCVAELSYRKMGVKSRDIRRQSYERIVAAGAVNNKKFVEFEDIVGTLTP